MASREQFPADGHDLCLQLVVGLGKILDQATGCAGLLERERVQQRTDECVFGAFVFGTFHCTCRQRVLDNFQENAGFACLLAHRGHLGDRGASVFGCDQGVGLGGDVCQLGDYFLLLGQIESHCTPPIELRLRLLPCAVLGGIRPGRREHQVMFQGWAVLDLDGQPGRTQTCVNQKNSRRAPSTQGDSRGNRLSVRYCAGGDSLPMRASLPVAGMY